MFTVLNINIINNYYQIVIISSVPAATGRDQIVNDV